MTTKNHNQRRTNSLNSKKDEVENANKLAKLSKKLNNTYILSVFELTKKEDVYRCIICPDKPTLQYKNLKRHLLDRP